MVSTGIVFGAVFMVAMGGFAVGATWLSLTDETHKPKALQSDADADSD